MNDRDFDGSTQPATTDLPNPAVAFGMSLLLPGSGQLYCKKFLRGALTLLFFVLSACGVYFLFGAGGQAALFLGISFRIAAALYVFSFVDAYFTARELSEQADDPPFESPRVAAVLNLLTRGLGYFYLGERAKGLLIFVTLGIVQRSFAGKLWFDVGMEFLMAGMAADAYRLGKRKLRGEQPATDYKVLSLLAPPSRLQATAPAATATADSQSTAASSAVGAWPRVPVRRATGLHPAVPVSLATLFALAYTALVIFGITATEQIVVDQSEAGIRVESEGNTYTNARYGVALQVPGNWTLERSNPGIFVEARNEAGCFIRFLPAPAHPFVGLNALADQVSQSARAEDPSLEVTRRGEGRLGSATALQVDMRSGQTLGMLRLILAKKGSIVYLLVAVTHDGCRAEAEAIQAKTVIPQ